MSNAEEKSGKASTDMLPVLRDLDDMLIEKYCKDCES